MEHFYRQVNSLFIDIYKNVVEIEQESLKRSIAPNLTISQIHIIECIALEKGKGKRISDIAYDMCITVPSATIAINKLIARGFITKAPDQKDKRAVVVKLTRMGRRISAEHKVFHYKMVKDVVGKLEEDERNAIFNGLCKLKAFLNEVVNNGYTVKL